MQGKAPLPSAHLALLLISSFPKLTTEQVPILYWLRPHDAGAYVDLSTNDAASIQAASDYWVTCSAVSVAFICSICALSWWHQRRLRKMFRDEADRLDEDTGPTQPSYEALGGIQGLGVIEGREADVRPLPDVQMKTLADLDV